jgi:hypothetical protein
MNTRRKQKKGGRGSRSSSRSRSSSHSPIMFENSIYQQLDKCIKDLIIDLAAGVYRFNGDGDTKKNSNFARKMKTQNMTFEQAISACTKELLESNIVFFELYNKLIKMDLETMSSEDREENLMEFESEMGWLIRKHYGIYAVDQLDEDDASEVNRKILEAVKLFPKATIAQYALRKTTGQYLDPDTLYELNEHLNANSSANSFSDHDY